MRNAISWWLNTDAPRRDLPERDDPWQTAEERFRKLRRRGLLDRLIERLQLRLNEVGLIDPERFGIATAPTAAPPAWPWGRRKTTCPQARSRSPNLGPVGPHPFRGGPGGK